MKSYVINHSCISGFSRSRPFSSWKSFYRRRHLRSLDRRITKIELQLKLNCEETTAQQSRLSLKQIQRRVERIERHLKKQNQQAKLELSAINCLKFLLPVAKHWHNIGVLLGIDPDLTLEQIEADYPGDCQQCVREMIKSWLKQVDPPPSWKDLAEAVQIINPQLGRKILNSGTNAAD